MGNWTTDKTTTYHGVRLTSDAKHFPASGEGENKKYAATFLSIVDGTKGGEDIFVDAKVQRGAEKLAGLKKGQEVTVIGTVEFKIDERTGKLRGKIWDATVKLPQATRDALKVRAEAEAADAARTAEVEAAVADVEGDAPAFE